MTPKRIQRRRTKGWRKPPGAVCVSRPSKHGNPFHIGSYVANTELGRRVTAVVYSKEYASRHTSVQIENAQMAVDFYRAWAEIQIAEGKLDLEDLRDKDLACWCKLSDPCHADVLLELANREGTK